MARRGFAIIFTVLGFAFAVSILGFVLPLIYWAIKGLPWSGKSIALVRQRLEGGG